MEKRIITIFLVGELDNWIFSNVEIVKTIF